MADNKQADAPRNAPTVKDPFVANVLSRIAVENGLKACKTCGGARNPKTGACSYYPDVVDARGTVIERGHPHDGPYEPNTATTSDAIAAGVKH